jgi:hypothetical protein
MDFAWAYQRGNRVIQLIIHFTKIERATIADIKLRDSGGAQTASGGVCCISCTSIWRTMEVEGTRVSEQRVAGWGWLGALLVAMNGLARAGAGPVLGRCVTGARRHSRTGGLAPCSVRFCKFYIRWRPIKASLRPRFPCISIVCRRPQRASQDSAQASELNAEVTRVEMTAGAIVSPLTGRRDGPLGPT